jgi:tetratricopeptide (TPR) repeat protein
MRKPFLVLALVAVAATAETKTGRELAAAAADAFQRGSAGEAIDLLQRALKLEPANPDYQAALGQIYLSTGQSRLAAPLLDRSLRAAPGDVDVRIALAQAYQNLDRDFDALHTLGNRPPREPYRPMWLFIRGFSLFRRGQIREADKTFADLLAYPDMRPLAHFFLANCRYVENNLEAALPEYEAAIREGNVPTNKALNAYYYNYGLTLYRLRNFDDAAAAFRKSSKHFSRDPLPRFFLARCLTEQGLYQQAIQLLEEVVAEFPDFPPALYQLARVQAAHGNKAINQELFRKYSALKEQLQGDVALERQIKLGN